MKVPCDAVVRTFLGPKNSFKVPLVAGAVLNGRGWDGLRPRNPIKMPYVAVVVARANETILLLNNVARGDLHNSNDFLIGETTTFVF